VTRTGDPEPRRCSWGASTLYRATSFFRERESQPHCIGCPGSSTPLPVIHGCISVFSSPALTIGSSCTIFAVSSAPVRYMVIPRNSPGSPNGKGAATTVARELVQRERLLAVGVRSTPRWGGRSRCSGECDVGHGPAPETRKGSGKRRVGTVKKSIETSC